MHSLITACLFILRVASLAFWEPEKNDHNLSGFSDNNYSLIWKNRSLRWASLGHNLGMNNPQLLLLKIFGLYHCQMVLHT